MIFNEISNKNNQDYRSYSDLITDKIMQFVRRTTGIETPSETYSTPETNLAYRDAIQLINRKMATGRLLIVGRPQMTHSEKCEELIDFMKGVNETHENLDQFTMLTANPPVRIFREVGRQHSCGRIGAIVNSCAIF